MVWITARQVCIYKYVFFEAGKESYDERKNKYVLFFTTHKKKLVVYPVRDSSPRLPVY